ncbi:hypothetical protein EW146_g754 [Bondarzewia mesenterica]|uniref:Jacalin-type lectin domain-containing protein n=1 Tax=Bondarzewia mesenterica TaxID=1095465 RepID=A0A4S4M860_9AGAM|nr:hypothetical protein EW146_g754 [Bondarzewia mesenterica]
MSFPVLDNLVDGEVVYQRFILVTGCITAFSPDLSASTLHIAVDTPSFPTQTFPVSSENGAWKALVHLQPGPQNITFSFNGDSDVAITVSNISYLPLLQLPPLHLAILVARDSPQWMDCPPEKAASPSHNDLGAAIKKIRTWAYMCQAYTAEEMRRSGFGRRSFRLDEEWAPDTLSISDEQPVFRVTAKVHIVKSDCTTAQIRDPNLAQQNPNARNKGIPSSSLDFYGLYTYFHQAIEKYEGPFQVFRGEEDGPVIAGLILDSHYDPVQDLITGHAALGGTGGKLGKVHLGMFGSHTHWAWPRFIEEITPCLLDATRVTPRSLVGNDNGECGTFWEACCIGQGAALHEVGHAFGLPHQPSGIMSRGYVEWNRSFVAKESYCVRRGSPAHLSVPLETSNHWHLADKLHLASHPMFALPGDVPRTRDKAPISSQPMRDRIVVKSENGIAHLCWMRDGKVVQEHDIRSEELLEVVLLLNDVRSELGQGEKKSGIGKLGLTITACDGAQKTIADFWEYATEALVVLPGCDFVVKKKSAVSGGPEGKWGVWRWAVLLTKLNKDGKVIRADKLQIQCGLWFDGVYVHYEDGTQDVAGAKRHAGGNTKQLGGGTTWLNLGKDDEIQSLRIKAGEYGFVNEVQFITKEDAGAVRKGMEELVPDDGEKIIGFYGKHQHDNGYCPTLEFGILTIPQGTELPKDAYEMPALRNTDGGSGVSPSDVNGGGAWGQYEEYEDRDVDEDEDEDDGEMEE